MNILTGIQNVLEYINNNWTAIVIILGLATAIVKKAKDFFAGLPMDCTADKLIRGVFDASCDPEIPLEKQNVSILLGLVKQSGEIQLFSGDQTMTDVMVGEKDKVIVFSNH